MGGSVGMEIVAGRPGPPGALHAATRMEGTRTRAETIHFKAHRLPIGASAPV